MSKQHRVFTSFLPGVSADAEKRMRKVVRGWRIPVQSNYSCGTGIIPEQASQTLPALNAIARATSVGRLGEQQDVSFPLMRAVLRRSCIRGSRRDFLEPIFMVQSAENGSAFNRMSRSNTMPLSALLRGRT